MTQMETKCIHKAALLLKGMSCAFNIKYFCCIVVWLNVITPAIFVTQKK